MEKRSLTQILSDLRKIWDEYKYTQYQAQRELQQGHGGIHQQKMIHCQHLKKKFNFLKTQLKYRIHRPGTRIKFRMGTQLKEGIFPSLSHDDAVAYIELVALINNCPLEILEISEIKSEIKDT